jgi:hypothetical protein
VLNNRISRNYSAAGLSFLLGQENNFVDNIERFKRVDFSIELYQYLGKVFSHFNLIQDSDFQEEEVQHEMHVWKSGGIIFYRMECYKSEYESVILFQLMEEDLTLYAEKYPASFESDQKQLQGSILEMLIKGYFDKPIDAYKLHQHLEYMLERRVSPDRFKTELEKLVGRKGKALLKRSKRRSYAYRYALHPDINRQEALSFIHQKFDKL